jgi:hypothetical protein
MNNKNNYLDKKFKCLEDCGEISKIIHISWKNKNILNSNNPLVVNGILNMKQINVEYEMQISDDNDVEKYIQQKISNEDYENIKNKHIVEKVDLWRLLKIYYEGGIYVDIDRYCNIPFRDIITKPTTKCILPTHKDVNFSQDIIISCKNNPIFFNAIKMNLNRRKFNPNCEIYYLGPTTYMNAVTLSLCGVIYNETPGLQKFNYLRLLLSNSKYFQTFREEDGGCDGYHRTLIYNHKLLNKNVSTIKDKLCLYNEYNIKFWGDK